MWWTEPPPGQEALRDPDVERAAERRVGAVAHERAFARRLAEAEHAGEDRAGALGVVEHQGDAGKTADRVLGRHLAAAPGALALGAGHADEREAHAVRVLERQHGVAEALLRRLMRHALLDEAVGPEADRFFRHPERRLLRLADSGPPRRHMRPGEEGQDRAGPPG